MLSAVLWPATSGMEEGGRKEGISPLASRLCLKGELNLERETGRNSKTKEGKKGGKRQREKKRRTGGNPQAATH